MESSAQILLPSAPPSSSSTASFSPEDLPLPLSEAAPLTAAPAPQEEDETPAAPAEVAALVEEQGQEQEPEQETPVLEEEDALTLQAEVVVVLPSVSVALAADAVGEGEGEGEGLSSWEDGGRVWLSIPGDVPVSWVEEQLTRTVIPAGIVWLSLGVRPTTAEEVVLLCGAVSAQVGRPVAGVRCQRGALSEGVRRLAGIAVELEGESPAEVEGRGRQVLVVERTLRSGAAVRFRGDVLVYGDVNAGAEIEAGGNIIVLGALRGLAWAGSGGDEAATIISFDLRPVQLRIGRQIAFLPERSRLRGARGPESAVVREGQIVLQEYRGRHSG